MADEEIKVKATPINQVEIKGAIAFSAEHARVWAEGTDAEVEKLGGEHSSKGWADSAEGASKEYTDEQIALAKTELTGQINTAAQGAVQTANTYTDTQLAAEASARQNADASLQSQIDAITAASDVFDVVGTYQDLLEYNTSTVPLNDIIKVLEDESRDDAATYYRWNGTAWSYIGSEGPTYTKSEADAKFLTQADAAEDYLSRTYADNTYLTQSSAANTYLTQTSAATSYLSKAEAASTYAKPSDIGNGTITLVQGGITKGTFAVNQSGNTSITLDGGGGVAWGNIYGTLSNQTDLLTALNAKADDSDLNSYVAKTGSTMTGDLSITKEYASVNLTNSNNKKYAVMANENGNLDIKLDSANGKGLFLNGQDNETPYYNDGTNAYRLLNTTDKTTLETSISSKADTDMGNVSANGKATAIGWGMPDYSAGIKITGSASFTCPSAGFVTIQPIGGTSGIVYVNGNRVGIGSNSGADASVNFIVSKNDVITIKSGYSFGTESYFYPLKGAN